MATFGLEMHLLRRTPERIHSRHLLNEGEMYSTRNEENMMRFYLECEALPPAVELSLKNVVQYQKLVGEINLLTPHSISSSRGKCGTSGMGRTFSGLTLELSFKHFKVILLPRLASCKDVEKT